MGESSKALTGTGLKTEAIPATSVNEKVLAYAMLNDLQDNVVRYVAGPNGTRVLPTLADSDWNSLVQKFKRDPKDTIAIARKNIFAIPNDAQLAEHERQGRLRRYVKAYLDLQIKLDVAAFPNTNVPQHGVPAYIPDGLVDMGGDSTINPFYRDREKLRVDKAKVFKQVSEHFVKLFSSDVGDSSSTEAKTAIVKGLAKFIYNNMPYDRQNAKSYKKKKRTVGINEILEDKLAVCRHHALYTQVILQACGITSKLLKCDVDFGNGSSGSHAVNVVRINNRWFILDATNPDSSNGVGEVFLASLTDSDIDPNSPTPKEWVVKRKQGDEKWKYRSRNNMFYYIQHADTKR